MEMTTIETKRSLSKFYGPLCLLSILDSGLAIGMVSGLFTRNGEKQVSDYFFFILGCVFFVLAIYTIIQFFRNAPIVKVDHEAISFNGNIYFWSEVAQYDLTGKQPYTFLLHYTKDGTKLTFKDGTIKYFFDDLYSNTWMLKSFIQRVVVDKLASTEITTSEEDETAIQFDNFETFKGNQFTSLSGILLWGLIVCIIFMVLKNFSRQPLYVLISMGVIILLWIIIYSYVMHYFELSDSYLVVKNINLFWKRKVYRIDNIKEISFEAPGKSPNSMRIITKDYRNKIYPAGTLRKKVWLDLKNKLELKGITVRNYCV